MLKTFELSELLASGGLVTVGIIGYIITGRYFSSRLPHPKPLLAAQYRTPVQRVEKISLLLALAIAFFLGLRGLTGGFDYDELYSSYYFIDVDSLWMVVSTYRNFNNHIGYSVLAWLGRSMLGKEEWVIRLPALLLGLATVYSSWIFSRRFFGARIAIFSSLLLAVSPFFVNYTRTARGYTGLIFFTLVSSYLYLKLLEETRRRDAALFILVSVLGIYFHLYAAWVIAVQFLYFVLLLFMRINSQSPDRVLTQKSFVYLWISYPLIFVFSLILYLPVLEVLIKTLSDRRDGEFVSQFPLELVQFFGGTARPVDILLLGIVAIGIAFSWRQFRMEASYLVLLLIIPLSATWLLLRPVDLYPRFFIFYLPYYLLFLAVGIVYLSELASRRFSGGSLLLIKGIFAVLLLLVIFTWTLALWIRIPYSPYREAVQELTADPRPAESFCIIGVRAPILRFYSEETLIYPRTFSNFQELLGENGELRCAVFEGRGNTEEQKKMSEFLMQNAVHLGEYHLIDIFWYSK